MTPNELVLTLRGSYVCANFGENRSQKCDRESARRRTDRQTDRHTHTHANTDFIICPMLYAIAMGQIINKVTRATDFRLSKIEVIMILGNIFVH